MRRQKMSEYWGRYRKTIRRGGAAALAGLVALSAIPVDAAAFSWFGRGADRVYYVEQWEDVPDLDVAYGTGEGELDLPEALWAQVSDQEVATASDATASDATSSDATPSDTAATPSDADSSIGADKKATSSDATAAGTKATPSDTVTVTVDEDGYDESDPEYDIGDIDLINDLGTDLAYEGAIQVPVKWVSDSYDGQVPGDYLFQAEPDYDQIQGYRISVTGSVPLPKVHVTVYEEGKQVFTQTIDGVKIVLKADEGVFPTEAKLCVEKIAEQEQIDKIKTVVQDALDADETKAGKKVEDTITYDIKVMGKDESGAEVELQPDTGVGQVTVTFKNVQTVKAGDVSMDMPEIEVYHVEDSLESAEPVKTEVNAEEKEVEIQAEHFSLYTMAIQSTEVYLNVESAPKAEIALAAGDTKVNYANFNTDLKAAVTKKMEAKGITGADVEFLEVDASAQNTQNSFSWWTYDHSTTRNVNSENNKYIEQIVDQGNNNTFNSKPNHIGTNSAGTVIDFFGYGASGYKDFNFLPNNQATKKVIQFSLDERADGSTTAYDALDGFGFLINSSITGQYASGQVIDGYLLFFQYSSYPCVGTEIKLIKLSEVDTYNLHHGTFTGQLINSISSSSDIIQASTQYGNYRYRQVKIEVMPEYIKVWYNGSSTDNSGKVLTDGDLVTWPGGITELPIKPSYNSDDSYRGGYGPLISYRGHSCTTTTNVRLSNLSMTADYVRSLTEVVRQPSWNDEKVSFLVNLNESPIDDFSKAYSTSEIINRLEDDDITYIGWCGSKNVEASKVFVNGLAEGSGLVDLNTVKTGTDPYSTDSYKLQIDAIADLVTARLTPKASEAEQKTFLNTDTFTFSPVGAALDDGNWSVGYSKIGFEDAKNSANISTYQNLANASFLNNGYYEIYYKGDTAAAKAKLRIHAAPVAAMTVTATKESGITAVNKSYDPEFCADLSQASGLEKDGITSSKLEYRDMSVTSPVWSDTAPATLTDGAAWLVRLTVTDADGATANTVQQVSISTGTTTAAPYGSFNLSSTQYIKGIDTNVTILDQSYALDGSTDFKVSYTIKNSSGTQVSGFDGTGKTPGSTLTCELSKLNEGTYTVTMTATKGSATSEPVSRTFKVVQGYTVTYDANNGIGAPSTQYKIKGTGMTLSKIAPTRTGYTFSGWKSKSELTEPDYQPGAEYTADANLSLTAVWVNNKFSVTLNGIHATGDAVNFGDKKATYDTAWTGTITPIHNYRLPATITVTVDGNDLNNISTPSAYTYDASTGAITLPAASVTGPIIITPGEAKPIFTKLEICKSSATGEQIVDLLDESSVNASWAVTPGADYYLNVELYRDKEEYVQLRYGNADSTANGVTYANQPGNTFTAGNISHDYFDQLIKYTNFAEPTYGSNSSRFSVQDGTLIYHIKKKEQNATGKVAFSVGFVCSDALYDGRHELIDAIDVAVGSYSGGTFTSTATASGTLKTGDMSIDLKLDDKNTLQTRMVNATATAVLGGMGNTVYLYALTNNSSSASTAAIYDTFSIDLTYPAKAELEYGFDTAFNKKHSTYGTLTLSEAKTAAAAADGTPMQTRTLTMSHGYKALLSTVQLYYRLNFNATDFKAGKYTIKGSNLHLSIGGRDVEPGLVSGNMITAYTVSAGGSDTTAMSAVNRNEVYNQTIDMEQEDYITQLGSAYIINKNGSEATPYNKIYEADFNISDTAADITVVTVPLGTSETPKVEWWGKDKDGVEKSGILSAEELKPCGNVAGNLKTSSFMMIYARDLGIQSITKVKATIGALRAGYTSSGWTSAWSFGQNKAGAFGSFTTTEEGIVVENTYHLYNENEADRDKVGGDLLVTSKAVSTDVSRAGMSTDSMKLGTSSLTASSSVKAGEIAKLNGRIIPYSAVGAIYDKDTGTTRYATTAFVNDPVIYLSLPSGLTPADGISFYKAVYNDAGKKVRQDNLTYAMEQIGDIKGGIINYRIRITGDNTAFGYYDGEGHSSYLYYTIPLQTNKSLATQRYRLNDLITLTTAQDTIALPYYNVNSGNLCYAKADVNGWNHNEKVFGIARDTDANPIGFGVQQQATIAVDTAISVTKINEDIVPAPEWYAYNITNPNSVAVLGKKSEGQLRLTINNTSDNPGKDFVLVLPIPKKNHASGSLFTEGRPEFDLTMSKEPAAGSSDQFQVSYGSITGEQTDANQFFTGEETYTTAADAANANALIITADNLAKGNYQLYFDYTVADGTANASDIWRPVYTYQVSGDRRYNTGGYVASSVAETRIEGVVFRDLNRDGIMDTDDQPISGIKVTIRDGEGRTVSKVTAADGTYTYSYAFSAVRESAITVTFEADKAAAGRFNVAPAAVITGTFSSVTPAADGLSAERKLYVSGESATINAAMSDFVKVTYTGDGNTGGNVPANQEYISGAETKVANKADNLVKKGYKFTGWKADDAAETIYQPGETFTITKDVVLTAQWEVTSYLVTFNYRGAATGNTEGSRVITHNTTYSTVNGAVSKLPAPSKTGFTFVGWSTSATATSRNVTDTTKFTAGADQILYAVWKAKTGYKVTYDTAQGAGTFADKTGVNWDGSGLIPTAEPVRTGYSFEGWSCKDTRVTETSTYQQLAADDTQMSVTLTAGWKVRGGYTVTYDTNGSSAVIENKTGVKWTDAGLLPDVNPVRKNFAFAGWKLGSVTVTSAAAYGSLTENDSAAGITLTAEWKEIQDNIVSYYTAGGSAVADKNGVKNTDSGLLPNANPTKAGYTFDGWYYGKQEITERTIYEALTTEKTLTLSAHWSMKSYTVTYDSNGSADAFADKMDVNWTAYDLLPAKEPKREGYVFLGWYVGSGAVNYSSTIESLMPADVSDTLTIQARWQENTYTVIYDSVGGTYFTPKTSVRYSAINLLPDAEPVKKGFVFEGWYVASGIGADTRVTAETVCGTIIPAGSSKVTLTAHWTAKTVYHVTYNTSGGTALESRGGFDWQDAGLLPKEATTRAGYTLAHWTVGRKTITDDTRYGELAQDDTDGTGITLVAVWQEKTGYVVRFRTGCDTTIEDLSSVHWTQNRLLPGDTLTRDGAAFAGWTAEKVTDDSKVADHKLAANDSTYSELAGQEDTKYITLTALWNVKDNYIVNYDTNGGGSIAAKNGVKWTDMKLLPEEAPEKPGYQFTGWYLDGRRILNDAAYSSLAAEGEVQSVTLTAGWRAKTFTVQYDTDGGSAVEAMTEVSWIQEGVLPETDPTKDGYTFKGWYYGETQIQAADRLADFMSTDEEQIVTLKAVWDVNSYTVVLSQDSAAFKLEAVSGSTSPTEYQQNYSFIITPEDGYSKTDHYQVEVCGTSQPETDAVTLVCDADEVYTIVGVKEDMIVKVSGVADVTAPKGEIILGKNKFNSFLNTVTFGYLFKETQSVEIKAEDTGSGINQIQYYISSEELSVEELAELPEWSEEGATGWQVYTGSFSIEPDSKAVVYARITDHAENALYISSDGLVLDATAPVISGVEAEASYAGSQIITITDFDEIASLKVNGAEVLMQVTDGTWILHPMADDYTIEATDRLGHTTTLEKIQVNKAVPVITKPQEFTIGYGKTLGDIVLPKPEAGSFLWDAGADTGVGERGDHTLTLTYQPEDTTEYVPIKNITVIVHVVKGKMDAPTVAGQGETWRAQADGALTGILAGMEYKTKTGDESSWKAVTAEEAKAGRVGQLAAGSYLVRYAADENYNPGAETEVMVEKGQLITVTFTADGCDEASLKVQTRQVEYHGSLEKTQLPAVPAKARYNGRGWKSVMADQTALITEIKDITEPMVYEAVYSVKSSGGDGGGGTTSTTTNPTDGHWNEENTNWTYTKEDGSLAKNEWQLLSYNGQSKWYHFDTEARMDTGWLRDTTGDWYYLNVNADGQRGAMQIGWITDPQDGHRYYLDPISGKMVIGHVLINGVWYDFNASVPEASGWYYNEEQKAWLYDTKSQIPLGALLR